MFSSFVFCFHYVAMAYTKPGRTLWSISEAFLGLNDIPNQILSKFKNELGNTRKVEFWLKNKCDFFSTEPWESSIFFLNYRFHHSFFASIMSQWHILSPVEHFEASVKHSWDSTTCNIKFCQISKMSWETHGK